MCEVMLQLCAVKRASAGLCVCSARIHFMGRDIANRKAMTHVLLAHGSIQAINAVALHYDSSPWKQLAS